MDALRAIDASSPTQSAVAPDPARPTGTAFAEKVRDALGQTNELLVDANRAAEGVVKGEVDAVEAVLALSKAELALRHAVTMSTRALEAYQQVMRLQL
ncbi:MAG: flagellar hook-basal body complex protein FliE [Myxococcales bacterium]|nr:flagellar hook-basal body complex protein FliE [Myxococcales bacterium]